MQKYTINDVAKLHQTTKKALLHYEKKELFTPYEIDPITSYRYYISDQFSKLKTILALKSLGCSIEEIKEYFEKPSTAHAIDFLECQLEKISTREEELKRVKSNLISRLKIYKEVYALDERHLNHLNFKQFPERHAYYNQCKNYPLGEEVLLTFRELISSLGITQSLLSRSYGDIYLYDGLNNNCMSHVGAFLLSEGNSSQKECNIKQAKLEEGCYATMFKRGGYPDESALHYFLSLIEEKGFRAAGHVFAFSLLDQGDTSDVDQMIYEYQVLIK